MNSCISACNCPKPENKPFTFEITNGVLTIPCLRFASDRKEAIRIAIAQHGGGWKEVE